VDAARDRGRRLVGRTDRALHASDAQGRGGLRPQSVSWSRRGLPASRPGLVCTPQTRGTYTRLTTSPFLLVNPRSGDERPSADELVAEAKRLGIESRLLRPDDDIVELAEEAAARGASALGIAGGDGSLAGVAAVAIERDLPFAPIPFGTRNHFARDAGFDRDDPVTALAAFHGDERRVDVGAVGDRVFLNNVSLGLYASLVHDPRHETKNRVVALARIVPAALGRSRRPLDLSFEVGGHRERRRALVALVANNDYGIRTLADLGGRPRLDEGLLHAYVIEAAERRTLLALLGHAATGTLGRDEGFTEWSAPTFRIESTRPRIHAAIDGEPVALSTPLEFAIKARALRVLVPAADRTDAAPPSGDSATEAAHAR
jgi:diacylglycerol kinase family enzyme